MSRLLPRSLLNRVFLLFGGMLSILVLGGLALSLRAQLVREIDDANDTATMVIEIAAQSVADAAVVNDLDAIQRTLAAGVARTPFGVARYIEVDGNVLAANAPPRSSRAPDWLRNLVAQRLPDINRVVEVGGRDYGVLRLTFLIERVSDYLWLTLVDMLTFGCITLLAGLAATRIFLSRWLSSLGHLQEFVQQIQSGQLDAKAPVSLNAPDEIRRTLDQFQLVASQFQNRFGQRIGALTHALVQHKRATDHAVIVIELDPLGKVLYANDLHAEVSGFDRAHFIGGESGWSLDIASYRRHAELFPQSATWKGEVVCYRRDGGPVWVRRAVVAIYRENGLIEKYICLDIDISAEKIAGQTLMQEKKRAEITLHSIADGVITLDRERRVDYANAAFTQMTGHPLDEVRGLTPSFLRSPRVSDETYAAVWLGTEKRNIWRGEIVNCRKDGTDFWCGLTVSTVFDEQGRLSQYVLVLEDIDKRKKAEETIHRLAYFDSLTQLPNRRMFMEHAGNAIAASRLTGVPLHTCYLDLDGFKDVNDSLGHHVGDILLAEAGQRISACLSPQDFIGRIGGDEFALLLPQSSFESARELGRWIIRKFDAPFLIDQHEIRISTSIGVSVFPDDGGEVGDLLRKADMALYKAKELGKRKLVFFSSEIETGKLEKAKLQNALRGAMQRQELHVVYQPKVDLTTHRIVGAEALMRWRHPEYGVVGPDVFIPLAEESRMIIPMGRWIIEQTCRQIRSWTDQGMQGLTVSVNISAVQFRSPDLAGDIQRLLTTYGVAPAQLELEVTESALMQDPEHVAVILSKLRDIGLTIAIDDFGTGYSSLAYLKSFPVGVLKIDREFVRGLETGGNDKGIAEAIMSMAGVLGMQVVAEGVENAAQAGILLAMGCRTAQGYHFGKPMPSEQFQTIWSESTTWAAPMVV